MMKKKENQYSEQETRLPIFYAKLAHIIINYLPARSRNVNTYIQLPIYKLLYFSGILYLRLKGLYKILRIKVVFRRISNVQL